jgi:hypothetical protein
MMGAPTGVSHFRLSWSEKPELLRTGRREGRNGAAERAGNGQKKKKEKKLEVR